MIEIPNELKIILGIFVTAVVTEVLKILSAKLNVDLTGYKAQVTASVVGAILVLANALLSNIPAEVAPIASQLLVLVVVVLGAFGAYRVVRG